MVAMVIKPPVEVIDGRYEVGAVIGRGAMGEVRRGRDVRLGREVAVKHLRADLAADRGVRSRFEDEARAAARLSHPAIVTVFDSGEWEGVPYLVMECLSGRTLADELAGGPLPADRVRAIGVDVAGALATAHDLGVIHRDVKPGNILVTDTGSVKLADFGIAKSTETLDHTLTGTIVGTPAYLAPERLAGNPATAQSDLYSLGVILYEALTGDRPFRGDTPVALAHAIHTTTPTRVRDRLPGVDPALASAIDAAMAKDPNHRPSSAATMLSLLAGNPTQPLSETQQLPAAATVTIRAQTTTPEREDRLGARQWWSTRTGSERRTILLVGAAAFVAVVLMVSLDNGGGTPQMPPTTVAPGEPLPAPLDDALERLEESVQP